MEKELTVAYKSKKFAIRIVNLYRYLNEEKKEYVLSKQLLRSGTSIGANIAESECAISKKDFLSKIYIAFKEANETIYWLDLLFETEDKKCTSPIVQREILLRNVKYAYGVLYKDLFHFTLCVA